jgi:type II secretory pathway pseudopilin PulG
MSRMRIGRRFWRSIVHRGRVRDNRGSTLIELLIATAIMGTSVVALLTGTGTLFSTSAGNRQSATAGIVARNYAEALNTAVSQTTAWCTPPAANPYGVSYTPPSGFSVAATYGACPTNNAATVQIQSVIITATAPNGSTEVVRTIVRAP